MVKLKFNSFSHTELLGKEYAWIQKFKKLEIVPIDEEFPRYVIENEEYLKSIVYIAKYKPATQ